MQRCTFWRGVLDNAQQNVRRQPGVQQIHSPASRDCKPDLTGFLGRVRMPAASLRRPRATSRDLSPGENRQVPQRPGACAIIRGRGLTRGAILTMGDDGALLLVRFTIGDDGEIPCFIQFVIIHAVQSFTIVHEHPQSSDVARHDRARSHAMPHDTARHRDFSQGG